MNSNKTKIMPVVIVVYKEIIKNFFLEPDTSKNPKKLSNITNDTKSITRGALPTKLKHWFITWSLVY
jgi:hypothetical protein